MYMPPNTRLKLDPRDEYTHEPEPVSNYNESMYFNAFDSDAGLGLWVRIGNRPNEGHAEMTCCVYLPDGRVGFMYRRPALAGNAAMDAAGMRFDVVEPFRRHRVRYEGDLLLMDEPMAMADPGRAFKRFPQRPAHIELDFEGVSPMHGGEIVTLQGERATLDPEHAVYRGHTEQNMAVAGHVTIDGVRHDLRDGTGYRDKSWGPRHWHSFYWYKWLPVTFGRDFGILLSLKGRPEGGPARVSGNVLRSGIYEPVLDGRIDTDYDPDWVPRSLAAHVTTASGTYTMTGRVLTTVPLRHKRSSGDGRSYTRIVEAMTEYRCGEHRVLGMTEYCDLMTDGVPVSVATARAAA
ncbi:DUF7064 domain-containing protein [Piscinibacter koreensis]|uniref:DUF7064 domain-containing protein n=1 Tax=Piscinibacter koreensis TaxID=2742824 RepID=A0A7Y6NN06_9BURK|nr:hypothetical protein [Schlegelella koreensis]NUZ06129.1 hypothetical protein [Schlegelella koreensis]